MARPVLAAALVLGVAGCGTGASPDRTGTTFPPMTIGPGTSVTEAAAVTRAQLEEALRGEGLRVFDAQVPYRPAEARRLSEAPRDVIQVQLANARQGYVSIYEFADGAAAGAAAAEQASYVASGPGRIQFPSDSRFVIRQLGRTVIFYSWSPAAADDPDAGLIEDALERVGSGIPVPG